jgi:hypothetical protein
MSMNISESRDEQIAKQMCNRCQSKGCDKMRKDRRTVCLKRGRQEAEQLKDVR